MRIVASPGKSSRRRWAICCGLHALAQRRSCRGPCRRPFQGTVGPGTAAPLGAATMPDNRSCTYVRSVALAASFAGFGRRAARSACHCATVARYSRPPLRVAALRRNSREIVDADRPTCRAISRMPAPCARRIASSSRSASDRYRPDSSLADRPNIAGGIPPAFRNHLVPTACGTPAPIAASSLDKPVAIPAQNRRCSSRPATGGLPGDINGARPDRAERRFRQAIAISCIRALRRPLESTLRSLIAMMNDVLGPPLAYGHLERVQHQFGLQVVRHGPADDLAAPDIEHHGQIKEARRSWQIGDVCDP